MVIVLDYYSLELAATAMARTWRQLPQHGFCQDGDLPNIVEVDDDKATLIKEVLQLQNTLDGKLNQIPLPLHLAA
jgi:hypothetical protein